MKLVMDVFLRYLGNWQFIAMIITLYYLLLRGLKNKFYYTMWNSIKFNRRWIPLSITTATMLFLREYLLYPLTKVQSWMPNSYLWEQLIMWLYTTHVISITTYMIFIYYFWKKYNSFIPALILGFFSIAFIEFTFIPQHLYQWNVFIGWNWYYPFAIAFIPMIVEYKRFHISNWKKFSLFMFLAVLSQYLILIFVDYSISIYDFEVLAYRLNLDMLPHPPIQTWLFAFMNSGMKILFLLGLSNITLKEEKQR